MSADVIEAKAVQVFDPALTVSKQDLDVARERRRLLVEFVQSQMKQGIDGDYAVIPGTKKQSLLKPGAEKLAKLFGLGVRISLKDKEIDFHQNFAMFSYTMEAYHLQTGTVIAQCEGSANSHEIKYKTRYKDGAREETPIGDVMNTLMKMAQKRAYVGVIIQAVGASDFYTQDIEDEKDAEQLNVKKEPARAQAAVPKVVKATSSDESSKPECCGRTMMVSKFNDSQWYCVKCKATQERTA